MFVQMIKLNCYSDKSTTFYNTQAITDCKSQVIMSCPLLQPLYVPKLSALSLKVQLKTWEMCTIAR